MLGKPHFEIYREGMKACGRRSASNAFLTGSLTDGQWRWRLVGANGESIAYGRPYFDKDAMLQAIRAIAEAGGAEIREVDD